MKTHLKQIMLALTLVFTFASCSSDNDDNGSVNKSKDVKYEVTGNYTGTLSVTYMEAAGGVLIEDITKLPWTKEFTATDAPGASLSVSGYGGTAGQTLTVKTYIGGKVEKQLTATATQDGIIVAICPTYVFPL